MQNICPHKLFVESIVQISNSDYPIVHLISIIFIIATFVFAYIVPSA